MGFLSDLKRGFEETDYILKHPFKTHIRTIQNKDIMTGEQLSWAGTNGNRRIKNLRETMEKYDIEHLETIESVEEKINEISMQLKSASSKEERTYLLHELDYYYDKLDKLNELNNTKETDRNIDNIR